MEKKNPALQRWDLSHNPDKHPLGCNGKYGKSGANKHQRDGTPTCRKCKDSENHYWREKKRGHPKPRILHPCGTPAAARRHRRKGEPLCFPCKVAANDALGAWKKAKAKKS